MDYIHGTARAETTHKRNQGGGDCKRCSLHRDDIEVLPGTTLPCASRPSSEPPSASDTASSVAARGCSYHDSPLSLRITTTSRSLPRREAKWGTSMMMGLKSKKGWFLCMHLYILYICITKTHTYGSYLYKLQFLKILYTSTGNP